MVDSSRTKKAPDYAGGNRLIGAVTVAAVCGLWIHWAAGERITIDFVGDSITAMQVRGNSSLYGAARIRAINRGLGGATINDLSMRLPGWIIRDRPDMVCLMAGTNSLGHGETPRNAFDDLCEMIKWNPSIQFLVSPPPWGRERGIGKYRALVMGLRAPNVAVLDVTEGLEPYLMPDGVHPNAAGQRIIAQRWITALTEVH